MKCKFVIEDSICGGGFTFFCTTEMFLKFCFINLEVVLVLAGTLVTCADSSVIYFSAHSLEECGRYLETIKVYENKSADSIKERMDTDYMSRVHPLLLELSFYRIYKCTKT